MPNARSGRDPTTKNTHSMPTTPQADMQPQQQLPPAYASTGASQQVLEQNGSSSNQTGNRSATEAKGVKTLDGESKVLESDKSNTSNVQQQLGKNRKVSPDINQIVGLLLKRRRSIDASIETLCESQGGNQLASMGYSVSNLKVSPPPVAGKVCNLRINLVDENHKEVEIKDFSIFTIKWYNGSGDLISKKWRYVPLVDEVGESLRVECSLNGGKSCFSVFTSPVLPHEKLALAVMEVFLKKKPIEFDAVAQGKGWGKEEHVTDRLSVQITKDKVKLRQRGKTTMKEPHSGVVMAFSDRKTASTLHIKIGGNKYSLDVQRPMHRDTLVLLMRMYRSSKKLDALQDFKTSGNKEQRRIALVMRAGGFARSITHQNDRFNDNKSSNKAILEGDNPKKIDNEETYDLDRVRRILEEAEATKQIGDGVSRKILSLLGMTAEECDSNVSKDDSLLDEMRRFEHDDHVQEPNSIRHEVGEGGKVSDVGLSSVLTEALVGSMFNEENEPRNRTLSTEQLQQTDYAKSNSLNPVQEATNDEISDGNTPGEYSDYQYRPRNDVEMAYFNRLFVHAGALKATDQLEGKTLCLFLS